VHYLSAETQNEFISVCSDMVAKQILLERNSAKYFSIMVDATPDSSHHEQTTFILRYLIKVESTYVIEERFLKFVDCSKKTGADIGGMILETLKDDGIPFADCRGQGYDNGANMTGKCKGDQALLLQENALEVFSPCGCHTLNLCGTNITKLGKLSFPNTNFHSFDFD